MKLVLAATGASGAIYLQRLLDRLAGPVPPKADAPPAHEIHLVVSDPAKEVIAAELGAAKPGEPAAAVGSLVPTGLRLPAGVRLHDDRDMSVPFVSGSARFDAMAIVPCSMGTLGRIAAGTGDSVILRAADVFLKERRPLVLVPREMPWSLVHARNAVAVLEAGARLLPACPHFYHHPESVGAVADTVVERILDQLGLANPGVRRWQEP